MEAKGLPVSLSRPGGPSGIGYILASTRSLRARMRGWARHLGLQTQRCSAQLGVDSAGGAPLQGMPRFAERLAGARRRRSALTSLARQGARPHQ
eukprot:1643564-Pyramimonas_sp.AAC.1